MLQGRHSQLMGFCGTGYSVCGRQTGSLLRAIPKQWHQEQVVPHGVSKGVYIRRMCKELRGVHAFFFDSDPWSWSWPWTRVRLSWQSLSW